MYNRSTETQEKKGGKNTDPFHGMKNGVLHK